MHIARKDFERVQRRLDEGDSEDAAFHLQQAAEKYLKAYLIHHGWKLQRIHDISLLIKKAVDQDFAFMEYQEVCQKATEFYILDRYPFMEEFGPDCEVVNQVRDGILPMVERIEREIGLE